jgi:hypothetical protein
MRINPFFVAHRYPFSKKYAIFQKVDIKELNSLSCKGIYKELFKLKKYNNSEFYEGQYITITHQTIINKLINFPLEGELEKEATFYRKLKRENKHLFLNRCKHCNKKECDLLVKPSRRKFTYVKFEIKNAK